MTGITKLFMVIDWHRLSCRALGPMTGDTARQTVFRRADPAMYRFIPLMLNHLHVIPTHKLRRFHAAFLARGPGSRHHEVVSGGLNGQGQQGPGQTEGDEAASEQGIRHRPLPSDYSPSPILM